VSLTFRHRAPRPN